MKLENSVAIVTGGASGLGRATAERFVAHGAKVVLLDREQSPGAEVAKSLGGDRAIFVPSDVTSEELVQKAVDAAIEKFGALHVAVNCAGIGIGEKTGRRRPAPRASTSSSASSSINLIGTFNVIRLAAARDGGERRRTRTASAASSSTPRRSRRSTARSARPPTRRRRAASSA